MRHYKLFSTLALLVSFQLHADPAIDKTQELNGVQLSSGKEEAHRIYNGKLSRTFPFPIELVKKSVTNFSDKCNNDYRSKRQYVSEEFNCKYHNENLVESFVVKDIKPQEYLQNLTDYYLIGRQIYNRGSYGFYELVQVKDSVNEKNQKTSDIKIRMLTDEEVKLFTDPKFARNTAFDHSASRYTLVAISPNETLLTYEYNAGTDHWILNKEISVPQVFASISKTIVNLMNSVEAEASVQKRELASQK